MLLTRPQSCPRHHYWIQYSTVQYSSGAVQEQYSSRYTEIAAVIRMTMLLTPPLSCPRHPPPLSTFTLHLRCTVGSYRGASGQNMTRAIFHVQVHGKSKGKSAIFGCLPHPGLPRVYFCCRVRTCWLCIYWPLIFCPLKLLWCTGRYNHRPLPIWRPFYWTRGAADPLRTNKEISIFFLPSLCREVNKSCDVAQF